MVVLGGGALSCQRGTPVAAHDPPEGITPNAGDLTTRIARNTAALTPSERERGARERSERGEREERERRESGKIHNQVLPLGLTPNTADLTLLTPNTADLKLAII